MDQDLHVNPENLVNPVNALSHDTRNADRL
jgi:hypothetical protein